MIKKKILLISPTPSHPANAGNRMRIYSLASCIRDMGHDIYFLHVEREQGDKQLMSMFWKGKYFSWPYTAARSWRRRIFKRIEILFNEERRYIYRIDDWYDKSLDACIKCLSNEIDFDVVIVEYVFFSRVLECFDKHVTKIIDTHDVFTNRHKALLRKGIRPQWYSTTANEEAKGLNRADVIISIQKNEREIFSRLTDKKVITAGHVVQLEQNRKLKNRSSRILYVGSSNPTNIQAIEYFLGEIFPEVRVAIPEVELYLAGKVCNTVPELNGVQKLGEIDNLADIYRNMDMVINPVLIGTGLKIKNIEALGFSMPLVTTSVGAQGMEYGAKTAFLVADSTEEYIKSVVNILTDHALSASLRLNAYEFAKRWNQDQIRELKCVLAGS